MSENAERAITVLMIDDDADDALLAGKLLSGVHASHYRMDWAKTYADGLTKLRANMHDICLLDYHLGPHNGLELLDEARRAGCRVPVILLTGLGAEEVDRAAMAAGALDYLSKGELTASNLERSIRYGLQQSRTLQALQQARDELEHKVEERTAELAASEEALREANNHLTSANAALAEANAALAEADRRKDEFLAMLAHELRNPLAPIRNAVHILRTFCNATCAISDQTARQRDMIERQVAHMAHLLDDLLDVSRITRGKIHLKRERLDLRVVAEQAIESMRSQIEARRLTLQWQATSAPLPVDGDPTRLEQVLRNLLHNAAKYTEPGGCIWVTMEAEAADAGAWRAVIRVRDSGEGIAPELLEHIFEPFVQAEQSLARTQGGLGIGLSMVKSLMELHGGVVEAHSRGLGQGSEFIVRLPLFAEMMEIASVAGHMESRLQGDQTGVLRRILVVDDNEDAAASLADLLEIWGHEVRTVHDGRQALAAAREWPPEIVLLDIGLPGMDGYEVAHRLRNETNTADAYLVALTGYGTEEDRIRALEAGFNRHLVKPVAPDVLNELLAHSRTCDSQ